MGINTTGASTADGNAQAKQRVGNSRLTKSTWNYRGRCFYSVLLTEKNSNTGLGKLARYRQKSPVMPCSMQIPEMPGMGPRHSSISHGLNITEIKIKDTSEIFNFSKTLAFSEIMKHSSGHAELHTE